MIDWANLFFNTLWVLGLSLALAAVSMASWRASSGGISLRAALAQPGYRRALVISGLLFSLGLAFTAAGWWERLAWWGVAVYFLARCARSSPGGEK